MAHPIQLKNLRFHSIRVTERTEWTFAELSDGAASYVVEITTGGLTNRVVELLKEMLPRLQKSIVRDELDVAITLGLDPAQIQHNQALAVTVSALRTAVVGLQAFHSGIGLTMNLGGEPKESVPLYANINRSLLGEHRTAANFAAAAQRAAEEGFTIVKCAPFDDIAPAQSTKDLLDAANLGIDRVTAVRSAVGPNVELFVDCHSRFDQESAVVVAEKLHELGIGWFEEPIPPATGRQELAWVASRISSPIAGGEAGYGEAFFTDLFKGGSVSIVMPDIKYCGGVAEACRASRAVIREGGRASLHCPSGPVSQLASASVTASVSESMPLEHAVYEASWRSEVLVPPERIERGRFWFPDGVDNGAVLNMDMVKLLGTSWEA